MYYRVYKRPQHAELRKDCTLSQESKGVERKKQMSAEQYADEGKWNKVQNTGFKQRRIRLVICPGFISCLILIISFCVDRSVPSVPGVPSN